VREVRGAESRVVPPVGVQPREGSQHLLALGVVRGGQGPGWLVVAPAQVLEQHAAAPARQVDRGAVAAHQREVVGRTAHRIVEARLLLQELRSLALTHHQVGSEAGGELGILRCCARPRDLHQELSRALTAGVFGVVELEVVELPGRAAADRGRRLLDPLDPTAAQRPEAPELRCLRGLPGSYWRTPCLYTSA
jgi:hypothetical protein